MFDPEVVSLVKKLIDNGYEAYLVGGVVRDYLLGCPSHDYDVTTNAFPNEIKKIYNDYQIFSYGEKFGTIGINYLDKVIEITTFRSEDGYFDNRHPAKVSFGATLEDDCLRRDFTINAIAYDVKNDKIVDLMGGIDDLNNHIIRSVGIPDKRFSEDALRIIRAIRFSAKLGFDIEEETKESIFKNYQLLKNISKERITEEIAKIVLDDITDIVLTYYDVFKFLIPELNGFNYDLLRIRSNELVFRMFMFLNKVSDINKALNNFRFPKITNERIKNLFYHQDLVLDNDLANVRILLHKIGLNAYNDLNEYRKLVGLPYTNDDVLNEAIELGYQNSILPVNGRNIKVYALAKGEEIGKCLEEVFEMVVKEKIDNSVESIKDYLFIKYGKDRYIAQKKTVLEKVLALARVKGVKISVGASAMLYMRGVVDYFSDLDLSINVDDYELIKNDLEQIASKNGTKWGYIHCFTIDGVNIDLICKEYDVLKDCDINYLVGKEYVPLETLDHWLNRYTELGRSVRVRQIKEYMEAN